MSDNPFSSFNIEPPKKYQDQIRGYCATGGSERSREVAPFDRQVDLWWCAFVLGVAKGLGPVPETETYNATPASILSTDPYRITYLQAVYLARTDDLEGLADSRRVFVYCSEIANAGLPGLLSILGDTDDKPLSNLLDAIESLAES